MQDKQNIGISNIQESCTTKLVITTFLLFSHFHGFCLELCSKSHCVSCPISIFAEDKVKTVWKFCHTQVGSVLYVQLLLTYSPNLSGKQNQTPIGESPFCAGVGVSQHLCYSQILQLLVRCLNTV